MGLSNVDKALAKLQKPIAVYCSIQRDFRLYDISKRRSFQKQFNSYYRVRRSTKWQRHFYTLMQQAKKSRPSFAASLRALRAKTGRLEASFVSKLVATVNPNAPVIDQYVLKNFGLKLPYYGKNNREEAITEVYEDLRKKYKQLMKKDGQKICGSFVKAYPDQANEISDLKKVDLVLWQLR